MALTSKVATVHTFCHLNVSMLVRVRTFSTDGRRDGYQTDSFFLPNLIKTINLYLKGLLHYTFCCGYCGEKCYKSEKCSFFPLVLVLRPFQDYFTYFEPIVNQRWWAKTGVPGENPPDLPLQNLASHMWPDRGANREMRTEKFNLFAIFCSNITAVYMI